MHPIVALALVGTGQYNQDEITTGTPVDSLLAQLPEGERERKLLLAAGAWAIYRQAGQQPETIPAVPEPASPEMLPVCVQEMATLLDRMFKGEHDELLPEALELMRKAGLRLPHELLPAALSMPDKEIRAALFPVLGERGVWLSQFNTSWAWVRNFLPETGGVLPPDAETIWQEGTTGQRKAILRLLRAVDPAQAREWLEKTWKQEKADSRTELLGTFEVGLSADDEPFLEKALDDRAAGVRAIPPSLLAQIPTSAYAARMQIRANAMLSYTDGKLTVKPPTAIDKLWERDGIVAKPFTTAIGERAWWMLQVMARVPLGYWEAQFSATPAELVTAASQHKWGNSLIEGWSQAAQLYRETAWIEPLWDWWQKLQGAKKTSGMTTTDMRETLITLFPGQAAEQKVVQMFTNPDQPGNSDWEELLGELLKPWSQPFGESYLSALRLYVAALKPNTRTYPYSDSWFQSIPAAGRRLPPACFGLALQPWNLPDTENWQMQQWREQLESFMETLRMRQRLVEEIVQ